MATTEQKKQMLLESFDILKDSWNKKNDAIRKIIANMAVCDMPTAIEMWLYVIEKNKKLFPENSYNLFECVIDEMEEKLDIKKIAKAVFSVPTLVTYLFKETYDLSYHSEELLSCLIIDGENVQLLAALQLIASNPHLDSFDHSLGGIISNAIKRLSNIKFHDHYGQKVPESTKEVLYNFASQIEDKQERAEAMVAILDLD